jgi:hypothetical protein
MRTNKLRIVYSAPPGRPPDRPDSWEILKRDPMPRDPEALIEWAKRHIFNEPPSFMDAQVKPGHDGPGASQRRNLFRKLLKL